MKKKIAKYLIFYFILAMTTYVLQTTIFAWIKLKDVSPNLFIIIIVSVSLLKGRNHGALLGFIVGFICDAFYYGPFGFNTIIYMNVGFFSGYLYNYFYKESSLVPLILMSLMTVFVNYIRYFFGYVFRGKLNILDYLEPIFIPDLLYTAFLGFIIYNLFYLIIVNFSNRKKEVKL